MLACGETGAMVMVPPATRDSAISPCFQGFPAFLHRHFPPHSPPSHPLDPFQGICIPVRDIYGCGKDCLILIPFRLPQISCFTPGLKYFSSDSDNCSAVGIRPLLQFPNPPRTGPVLLTLLFSPLVPLSCSVLHGSFYSFPLVRYSCLLSAGVLHALLCLKVYS